MVSPSTALRLAERVAALEERLDDMEGRLAHLPAALRVGTRTCEWCGTSLENLVKLLGYPERILHPFGGMAETGVRVDLNETLEPDVVADAHDLPFEDESFDLVVLDPPYSDEEARDLYDTPKLRPGVYVGEAVRVLAEGGWLVVYSDREPARPPRCNHSMRIMVVLRPHHRPRIAGVFQKRKNGMPHYGTEPGEEGYTE